MGNVINFAEAQSRLGFERVKATYTVREISRQFGLSEHYIRRWTREGLIHKAPGEEKGELRFDYRALNQFRRVRDLRRQGLSIRQVDAELRGQLNLFPEPEGELIPLPLKLTPFEEALRLHERGDPRACELYLEAADDEECAADACCNLGILEFEAGKVTSAFNYFTRALRYDPRHFEAHFNMAHLYFESGDLRLARLHYELAAEIEPSFPDLYFNLGLVHAVNRDLDASIDALRRARDLSPEDEAARVEDLLRTLEVARKCRTDPDSPGADE